MAMNYLGDFTTNNTVYVYFNTFDSNDPSASVTLTGLLVSDIEIYKNGSATTRSSDSGYTLLDTDGIDFASITGIHGFSIDLSDNTDAGFYAAGGEYVVVVAGVTVDAATVNFVAASFSIERTGGALALLKGATGLAAIDAVADAILEDTAVIGALGAGLTGIPWNAAWDAEVQSECTDALNAYDPPTRAELTTDIGTVITDLDDIKGTGFVKDTHSLVDIEAYVDLIDDGTSGLAKIATDVAAALADTNELQTDDVPGLIAALNNLSDAEVWAYATRILTAGTNIALAKGVGVTGFNDLSAAQVNAEADTALADYDAATGAEVAGLNDPTAAAIADAVWDETMTAHVTADSAAVHLKDILADTNELQADDIPGLIAALNDIAATDVWAAPARALTANTNLNDPTAAAIADQVWEEAIADHSGTAGSTAEQLAAAGAGGDPWATSLPGAYSAGQAGKIVGDNMDATISSRSSHTAADIWSVATRVLTAGTNIALAKGVGLTGLNDLSQADIRTATGMAAANLDTQLDLLLADADYTAPDNASIAAILTDTGTTLDVLINAIKAKTDLIPGTIDGKTFAEIVTLISAVLLGKVSGMDTGSPIFRDMADVKNRVSATVDADGNRTAVTLDAV